MRPTDTLNMFIQVLHGKSKIVFKTMVLLKVCNSLFKILATDKLNFQVFKGVSCTLLKTKQTLQNSLQTSES